MSLKSLLKPKTTYIHSVIVFSISVFILKPVNTSKIGRRKIMICHFRYKHPVKLKKKPPFWKKNGAMSKITIAPKTKINRQKSLSWYLKLSLIIKEWKIKKNETNVINVVGDCFWWSQILLQHLLKTRSKYALLRHYSILVSKIFVTIKH